jgi:hypothetical protein
MANLVSNFVQMEGSEEASRLFLKILADIDNAQGNLSDGGSCPICSVLFGVTEPMRHNDSRLGGAKWVDFEEIFDGQLSFNSGWNPAFGVAEEIYRRLQKVDQQVLVWMTFQDEVPNFIGAAAWGSEDGSIKRADHWCELDDVEIADADEVEDFSEEELAEITTWEDVDELLSECLEAAKASVTAGMFGKFIMQRE